MGGPRLPRHEAVDPTDRSKAAHLGEHGQVPRPEHLPEAGRAESRGGRPVAATQERADSDLTAGFTAELPSSPPPPRREGWRVAGLVVVLATLYGIGALLPFWYLASPEAGAAFFPAAGLTVSFLLLSERRRWPLWLAVVAVTEVLVDVTHHQTFGM